MTNFKNILCPLCVGVAIVLTAAACGSNGDGEAAEPVFVEDAQIFPFNSLQDWVTYADQVSVVEIVAEERLEPEVGPESTHVGRLLTARVDRTLWSVDGEPAREVKFIANGWLIKDGKERPIVPRDGLRLVVGGTYVLPLFESSGEWGFLTTSSIIPIDGDRVHAEFEPMNLAAAGLEGIEVSELQQRLADTVPDPLAARVDPDLTPIQRAVAISELRDGISSESDAEEQGVPGRAGDDLPSDLTDEERQEIEGGG